MDDIKKLFLFLAIFALFASGITAPAFADDHDKEEDDHGDDEDVKTFESECAKKLDKDKLNLDGLFCQIIIALQGLIDSLDARVTELEDNGVGATGPQGDVGPAGTDGADAFACWDLNQDFIQNPSEDINGDTVFDVRDCIGPAGPPGAQGPAGTGGTSLSCENQLAIARGITAFTPDQSCFLCGNGVIDIFEQCDDGNKISGDGCSALCAFEIDYSLESCMPVCQGVASLCESGVCVDQCSGGLDQCNDICTDTEVDSNNCGGCGNVCSIGLACVAGNCRASLP